MKITDSYGDTLVVEASGETLHVNGDVFLSLDQVIALAKPWKQLVDALTDTVRTNKMKLRDDLVAQVKSLEAQIAEIDVLSKLDIVVETPADITP